MTDDNFPSPAVEQIDGRITELEIKLTHQERLLETLNQVMIEQQAVIEGLRLRVDRFEGAVAGLQEEPANEPPPHY